MLWVPELVRLENLGKRLNNQLMIILQIETLTDYNVEFVKCELNQQLAGQRLKSDHPSIQTVVLNSFSWSDLVYRRSRTGSLFRLIPTAIFGNIKS